MRLKAVMIQTKILDKDILLNQYEEQALKTCISLKRGIWSHPKKLNKRNELVVNDVILFLEKVQPNPQVTELTGCNGDFSIQWKSFSFSSNIRILQYVQLIYY
eukprot:snap_masked-scaffold_22-processed-gene-5.21-mRNA-1 protein AED:1.00 eAED:1.00 QI:0/0/0/0/1/1/4/0/102